MKNEPNPQKCRNVSKLCHNTPGYLPQALTSKQQIAQKVAAPPRLLPWEARKPNLCRTAGMGQMLWPNTPERTYSHHGKVYQCEEKRFAQTDIHLANTKAFKKNFNYLKINFFHTCITYFVYGISPFSITQRHDRQLSGLSLHQMALDSSSSEPKQPPASSWQQAITHEWLTCCRPGNQIIRITKISH